MTPSTISRGPNKTGAWTWGTQEMPIADLNSRAWRLWTWTALPKGLSPFNVRLDVRGDDGTGTMTVDGVVHRVAHYVGAGTLATFETGPAGQGDGWVQDYTERRAAVVRGG